MPAVDDRVVLAIFNTDGCFKNMISMHLFCNSILYPSCIIMFGKLIKLYTHCSNYHYVERTGCILTVKLKIFAYC